MNQTGESYFLSSLDKWKGGKNGKPASFDFDIDVLDAES